MSSRLWFAMLCTAACGALAVNSPPVLTAGRATVAPAIDGRPGDACWTDAQVATDFSVLASGGSERAFRQTTVRAAWDDESLYVLAVCIEPRPDILSAKATERDGPTWLDDAVEIFLRPDLSSDTIYHFIVNCRGILFDQKGSDPSFNVSSMPATHIGEQSWTVEMQIAWSELGCDPPSPGDEWGFNVGREHRPHEPTEWSTWAPLKQGLKKFGVPAAFGHLRFADTPSPGRASSLALPEGLIRNPWFAEGPGTAADHWHIREGSERFEIAPASRQYAVGGRSDYAILSQQLGTEVEPGDIFTVFAVLRGTPDATTGIAVIQEMADGRPDDLYPFWDITPSAHWQVYSGRIVVDKGAKRFKAAALYRSNRKGRVDCAYMQILPGVHGVNGIVDISTCTRPGERAVGSIWRTPSLSPFKPLTGGPIRTALFIGKYQRDAAELMQRLDLDADVIACPQFRGSGTVETVVAYDAKQVLRDLAGQRYDLIVLAGRPSEQSVIDAIIATVEAGGGLLVIDPLTAAKAGKPEIYQQLEERLPTTPASESVLDDIVGGLDPSVLKAQCGGKDLVRAISAESFGQGRMVRLSWAETVPGLIPFRKGAGSYWEYRWALVAKAALWATGRRPVSRLADVQVVGDMIEVTVRSPFVPGMRLAVTWDTPDGERAGPTIGIAPYSYDRTRLGMAIPAFLQHQRGPTVARVSLRRDAQPLDIGAAVLSAPRPRIRLSDLQMPEQAVPGQHIDGSVSCTIIGNADPLVTAELVDAFGRVVDRVRLDAPKMGASQLPVSLMVRDPLSVYHDVVVTARDGSQAVAARTQAPVFVPAVSRDHLSDFQLAAGYAVMHITCQPYLLNDFTAYLRAHGVTACTVNESLIMNGMPAWGGTVSGTGMAHRTDDSVRTHCFSDPNKLEALVEGTVKNVAKRYRWGFFGYNMHDEVHLSQRANVETCASEHCLSHFRKWAREFYGDIAAANREWGTGYTSFDQVAMPMIADMKGETNPARWVDYRLFMEQVWAEAYAAAAGAVRNRFADVRMSFTNPYKFNSLSGTDFSRWTPNEQVLLRYFHRHVMDRNRSWSRAPMLAWIGYRSDPVSLKRFMWWFALNGGTTPIWWDPILPWAYSGKPGYTPWFMFDPLWRETVRGREVSAAALELESGIGKLLRLAEPAPAEAVVLHSQASMHVLYAQAAMREGRLTEAGYNAYRASDDALAESLGRAGLAYTYAVSGTLTDEQLASVDLVALPSCVALEQTDVDVLTRFVETGGRVLADRQPGTHSARGKPLQDTALDPSIFDGIRGICLERSATKQDADALDQALQSLGIKADWRVIGGDGGPAGAVQVIRLTLADTELVGIVQGTDDTISENLLMILPGRKTLIDVRRGKRLGKRGKLSFNLGKGETALFAAMDVNPSGISVQTGVIDNAVTIAAAIKRHAALKHVFHVSLTRPGEAEAPIYYTRNVLAPGGKAVVAMPLGCDDPAGLWTVRVRDVLTGDVGTAVVSVARGDH